MITKDDLEVTRLIIEDKLDEVTAKLNAIIEYQQHTNLKLIDANKASVILNISRSTLWRYCTNKGLKYYKGKQGRRYFHYEDILEFIKGEM